LTSLKLFDSGVFDCIRVFVKTTATLSTRCSLMNNFSIVKTSVSWCRVQHFTSIRHQSGRQDKDESTSYCGQGEERDAENGTEGGDEFSRPRGRYSITVADRTQRYLHNNHFAL